MKEYYQAHREELKKNSREYYKKHKKEHAEWSKNYRLAHPEINLKANIKHIINLGRIFNLQHNQYKYALISWSKAVRKRDVFCQICNTKTNLDSHHIIQKKKYPQLGLNLNNGITLCDIHHKEIHKLNRGII